MRRALRRALRQWQTEWLAHWRRLNSFMRIVAGIVVAMAMVWTLRHTTLDDLQKEWEDLRKANEKIDLPLAAMDLETDSEIEATRMRIENIGPDLQEAREAVAALAQRQDVLTAARRGEALNTLDAWISETGLTLHSRIDLRDEPSANPQPVSLSRHRYVVTGSFPRLHTFIRRLDAFPYVSRFDNIDIAVREDAVPTGPVTLRMTFDCTLYFRP